MRNLGEMLQPGKKIKVFYNENYDFELKYEKGRLS